ncbi:MAG TPA: T9SS type A sorting domain-containing protein [Bacteroidia bacterium]|nr:T9SS type A sorting domain-containing protein [Bacteroidia bacterium]
MKSLLLLPFSLLVLASSAQVTLTSAQHGWVPGDVFNYTPCDSVGVNPGPSGTGQTWNFSGLNINGTPATSTYVSPGSTTYGSNFPTSTVALGSTASGYYYFQASSTGINIVGLGTPGYIMTYSDPDEYFIFPFSYGNTNYDTHAASYTISTVTGTRGGSTDLNADGSGTLILASGSYPVLRLKTTLETRDSLLTSGVNTYTTVYAWYSANQKFPLLQIQMTSQVSGSGTNNMKAVFVNSNVVGINDEAPEIFANVFPNPADNEINISAEMPHAGIVYLEIMDGCGRVAFVSNAGDQPAGSFSKQLDISSLAPGIYTLRLVAGDAVMVRKIAIR